MEPQLQEGKLHICPSPRSHLTQGKPLDSPSPPQALVSCSIIFQGSRAAPSCLHVSPFLYPGPLREGKKKEKANQVPLPFFCCAGVGDRELAEETGLARSAYMSSESALRTELLLEEALETEETLLTLRDLEKANSPLQSQMQQKKAAVRQMSLF